MKRWMVLILTLVFSSAVNAMLPDIHQHAFDQRAFNDTESSIQSASTGQVNVEGELQAMLSLASLYFQYERPDLLSRVVDVIEQHPQYQQSQSVPILGHFFRGYSLHLNHEYENAAREYAFGLELLKHRSVDYEKGQQYLTTVFEIYQAANAGFLQEYSRSIASLSALKNRADEQQWAFLSALSLYWLGDVSYELKHYEQAETYFRQSKHTFPTEAAHYVAKSQVREAQMTNIVGDRDQAFGLLDQAMEELLRLDDTVSLAYTYLLQSYFHSKNENHQAALEWIAKSVELREKLDLKADVANAYVHYSAILGRNNHGQKALEYAQKAAILVSGTEDLAGQWDAFANYATQLHANGNFQQAYEYMSKSERALLAKARLDITQETARLLNQFEFQQQTLQNQFLDEKANLLQSQLAQEQAMLEKQKLATTALAVFAFLILALLLMIYKLYLNNKRLVIKDPLTSLDNRRAILESGDRAFAMSHRYKQDLCVLMVGIDNFKTINNTYGHDVGDKALVFTAAVLKSVLRTTDSVGRVGGEEFLIALPSCDEEQALLMVKRLFSVLQTSLKGSDLGLKQLTVSMGLASMSPEYKSFIELAKSADVALYRAKSQGRNQVQVYQNGMQTGETTF